MLKGMDFTRLKAFLAAASILLLAACTVGPSSDANAPAIPGSFVWFDLGTDDVAASRAFYGGLFGWRFGSGNTGYFTISAGGTPIGGIFPIETADAKEETASQWIPVIGVDDVAQSHREALASGAQEVSEPVQTSDGVFSSFLDPTGALVDLYQGSSGRPISDAGGAGSWIWADHVSPGPTRAGQFYQALFGWEPAKTPTGERVFRLKGVEIAGRVFVPRSETDPNWLPYVAVADIGQTLLDSTKLGGRILAYQGKGAVLVDPTGAAFGVIEVGN